MVRDEILETLKTDKVKVYIVWTPVLLEDNRESAIEAMQLIQNDRAIHFWDEDKSLGTLLGEVVTLPRKRRLAWDVYFAYDAKSEWKDDPPTPAAWMHQLANDERKLDGNKLRVAVEQLLHKLD